MTPSPASATDSLVMDSPSEFGQFLRSHPRFAGLSINSVLGLQKAARRVVANKGSYIQHVGSDAGGVFLLTQGVVEAVTVLRTGEEHLLALLHPGALLGITAAFVPDRAMRRQNWLAHSDAVLWRIPIPDFRQCVASDPGMSEMVLSALSARIQWLTDEVAAAAVLPAECKVIRCLLGVGEPPEPQLHRGTAPLLVTHSKLALMLGLTRQSVAKVLRDLEARGLVQTERYRVKVLSATALRAYGLERGAARVAAAAPSPARHSPASSPQAA